MTLHQATNCSKVVLAKAMSNWSSCTKVYMVLPVARNTIANTIAVFFVYFTALLLLLVWYYFAVFVCCLGAGF
jgi:hypothetical protein